MHRKPKLTRRFSGSLAARPQLRIWTPPLAIPPRRPRRPPARRRLKRDPETTTPGEHCRSDDLARLEAALFVSRQPLSTRRLAKLARLPDGTKARALLRDLRRLHDESGAAFRVEQIAGGFQLLTRPALGPWVRRLLATPPENRLSAAALETLAIVAYRQPVTRAEIEAIRGVGCEEMLRQLLERDFVAIGGRTDDLGRPHVYQTTNRFLQAFGLARIEDLPRLESAGAADAEPAAEIPAAPPG
jgi:segregation and condensation protein B